MHKQGRPGIKYVWPVWHFDAILLAQVPSFVELLNAKTESSLFIRKFIPTTETKGWTFCFPASNRESRNDETESSVMSQWPARLAVQCVQKCSSNYVEACQPFHHHSTFHFSATSFSEMSLSNVRKVQDFCANYVWQSMPTLLEHANDFNASAPNIFFLAGVSE